VRIGRTSRTRNRRSEHTVVRDERGELSYTIFEGTSEIQRLVISRAISGMRIE
jgi:hypothetical protein